MWAFELPKPISRAGPTSHLLMHKGGGLRCQTKAGASACATTAILRAAITRRGPATRPRQQNVSACRLAL